MIVLRSVGSSKPVLSGRRFACSCHRDGFREQRLPKPATASTSGVVSKGGHEGIAAPAERMARDLQVVARAREARGGLAAVGCRHGRFLAEGGMTRRPLRAGEARPRAVVWRQACGARRRASDRPGPVPDPVPPREGAAPQAGFRASRMRAASGRDPIRERAPPPEGGTTCRIDKDVRRRGKKKVAKIAGLPLTAIHLPGILICK